MGSHVSLQHRRLCSGKMCVNLSFYLFFFLSTPPSSWLGMRDKPIPWRGFEVGASGLSTSNGFTKFILCVICLFKARACLIAFNVKMIKKYLQFKDVKWTIRKFRVDHKDM